jgi:uncharacterized protein YutE (UPF0331/DUF86 family)
MKIDSQRIASYLFTIKSSAVEIENTVNNYSDEVILQTPFIMKAIKYTLIEIAETMANTLQHILAKGIGKPVSGYMDTLITANKNGIITDELYTKMKPFFEFRNALVHRYWIMDDRLILQNLRTNYRDFIVFIEQIESWMAKK